MQTNGWLLLRFIQREVTSRFAGSMLGVSWALMHPVALLLIYNFVFTSVLKVRPTGDSTVPYTVLLALCLWPWMAFQEAVVRGAQSILANAPLINKVPFAHELVVYAAVAGSFIVQLMGYAAVLILLALYLTPLAWTGLPLVVFSLLSMAALAGGLALALGALQVFIRDIEQALAPALAMLFYLSPVLYTMHMTPEPVRTLMAYSPIAVLLEAIRAACLEGRTLPTPSELVSALACIAAAVAGRWLFRRLSPHFEEAL